MERRAKMPAFVARRVANVLSRKAPLALYRQSAASWAWQWSVEGFHEARGRNSRMRSACHCVTLGWRLNLRLRCRVHSKLSAAGTRHSVRSRLPAPGAGPHRPSGKHSRGIGQGEISQVGERSLSKHSGGQIACSLGRTNSMFSTLRFRKLDAHPDRG